MTPPPIDAASLRARLDELSSQVDGALLRDRRSLAKRLRAARQRLASGQPIDQLIETIGNVLAESRQIVADRSIEPEIEFDPDLPVARQREEIAAAIAANPVVVLCGETGSGKTTQLPKILLQLGYGRFGVIGHTQPRRIAARSVAERVASELNTRLGDVVGYKVRFHDQTSPPSRVKLMTDGILLAEVQRDPYLLDYDAIVIDEAHERSLNIDFLLGHLGRLRHDRPELKIVVTSATIDPERFSKHFDNAPILRVEGRTYPVETWYRPPPEGDMEAEGFGLREQINAALDELWTRERGDTLIFLAGEREIRDVAESLGSERTRDADVLPLYARLGVGEQARVFAPSNRAKIVLTTNVAETSVTVPGIRYVIDTGVARLSRYSPRNKIQRLPIEPISRASADQRRGRCGRVGPGICVRLYSETDYERRPQFTDPEILRTNLSSVILQMKAFGLGRIEEFPFIEPPDYRQVKDGYQTLFELGAIDETNEITDLGRLMARLPVDPKLARMMMAAREFHCVEELLAIASGLSIQDPRDRPMNKQSEADVAHSEWRVAASDFLGFLNLWNTYRENERTLSVSKLRKWCVAHFLSWQRMREWSDVFRQLAELVGELGWKRNEKPANAEHIHQALLAGLLADVGRRGDQGEYAGTRGRGFWLFPGSALFHRKPAWVMAAEVVETTKPYARIAAEIQPEWVEHAAQHLVKRTFFEPHWQRKTGRVMAYEKVLLHGLPIVNKRSVAYEQVDPRKSRELFIHHALVEGDVDLDAPFFRHNQQLIRDIELLEARTRRRDILADAQTRYAFYDTRVPAEVTGLQSFNRWRREAEHAHKRLLFMTADDLMLRGEADVGAEQFPTKLHTAVGDFELSYHFDPGAKDDGVSVIVPLAQLNAIPADALDWLVPGLIEEKLDDLIRTLPKPVRVNVVPAPDFARRSKQIMPFGEGNLLEAFALALGKLTGLTIRASEFDASTIPDFLKMNVRVIDEAGKPVASGRSLDALRAKLRDRLRELLTKEIDPKWHRDGLTTWDVGDLPERVEIKRGGATMQGFPGLIDQDGRHASLRLFDTPAAARAATRTGVRRLFVLEYAAELSYQVKEWPTWRQMALHFAPLGSSESLKHQLIEALAHQLITPDAADVRSRMEYELQLRGAWNRMRPEWTRIAQIGEQSLKWFHELSVRLSSKFPPLMEASVNDLREQLRWLMPADFLVRTPKEWLPHLPRYLQAASVRLTRLLDAGVKRDCERLVDVSTHWHAFLDLKRQWPEAQPESAALERYRWLIEEYRVSLFAQNLGTSLTISAKRLDEAAAAVVMPA